MSGDDIAVVGLAGRFPGADTVADLWRNLLDGVDAITDHTADDLRALGIGPGLLADPAHVRASGFVPGIEDFDAEFFGFTPDEAARTDPQHRLFLETAWQALEDAGHDPARGTATVGVFTSTSVNKYFLYHLFGNPALGEFDPDDWDGRLLAQQSADHLPGQVAYRLGLTGPAVAVQTACSSSLVAVCLAAQSLADYRCDLALAGGVSVTWPRYRHPGGGMVSADGRCRAFDADAAGSGFGTGAGVVALKRLEDAEADGDHVYALLPGWAVSNDGADRAGFAVPGLAGQMSAVAEAMECAEVSPADIGYVEAHGSGTPLGDAIEVEALTRAYRATGATATGYCALGAVKTAVGHLDAAAGVTGLITAVLAVAHGRIPPNPHFVKPNREIDFDSSPFFVPTAAGDWPLDGPRIAGVSAFGLGGTNAHVIVAEAPPAPPAPAGPGPWTLRLSARTPEALRAAADRLRAHLLARPDLDLADVAHTLDVGRRRFAHRAAVTCATVAEAVALLADPPAEHTEPGRPAAPGQRIPLPTYPFQRGRHWIDLPERSTP
ncbi:beta-ketoacyl synthase N-terminal-like domain-containing protein [Longispora sp. NPDC051575]|uniref:beta-ketoacyl synthase N-terminal-like domain-containing protein n=1 Tax=Longispora sp. NPDC051575 TaxID=3154943 RepID=UPI003435CF76